MSRRPTRGIDHVGIVVPDIGAATRFLVAAFGATVLYESLGRGERNERGRRFEEVTGVAPGAALRAGRMIALEGGPDVELFEMTAPDQRPAARGSDFGLTHVAFYADDMAAAVDRFRAAGGTMLSDPRDLLYAPERGEGNVFCYGRAPWGMLVEFIRYPGRMPYRDASPLLRHNAPPEPSDIA